MTRRALRWPATYLLLVVLAAVAVEIVPYAADGLSTIVLITLVMPWAFLVVVPAYQLGGSVLSTVVLALGAVPNAFVLTLLSVLWERRRSRRAVVVDDR